MIRRLAAAGHRKVDIAQAVGLSPQAISKITKDYTKCSENPVNTTTPSAEIESLRRKLEEGRSLKEITNVDVAKMAAVGESTAARMRGEIVAELETIPPMMEAQKITNSVLTVTAKLKDELEALRR